MRYFTVKLDWLDRGRFPRSHTKLVTAANVPAAVGKAIRGSKMYSDLKGWREREGHEFHVSVVVGAKVGIVMQDLQDMIDAKEDDHGD